MKNKLFLLGGHDLEMLEIKKILHAHGCTYEDQNLSWGAKLSDYKEFLDFDGEIYGIELEEDITPPNNYIQIDHHGKNDYKPSSLEQIAELLNIELTRNQKLIAANDSNYINGMKALCASQKEINEIRKLDRESQGITKEDELLAQKSFDASNKINTNYIFSQTPKFSSLSDLAYFKFDKYIIYNFSKILFYGYKKEKILEFLESQNISKNSFYYGGGEFGFVGIKDGVLSFGKIYNLLKEFTKVENKDELYSYHTFMLPFTFKDEFDKKQNWNYQQFTINEQRDYNEYIYFYKHVQDALYNSSKEENSNCISNYYEYKKQDGTYTINCNKGDFTLELDGISLRIFNTNVAILAFNLKNTKYSDLESILVINDFGRRIYPQFVGDKGTQDTKSVFLANCISLQFENEEPISENFSNFDTLEFKDLKTIPFLPKFIQKLIGENFVNIDKIRPIIDDRMFVISQYHNDALAKQLGKYDKKKQQYKYEENDYWYKYIFIDGGDKTCQSKYMSKKLLSESTYDRWVEWNTLFGVSRYSFVALTGSWFGKERLLPHMQTMYFQMFTLLLAYRATIIKFADDIQYATTNDDEVTTETKKVYGKYLKFLNKLFFKEITAQDQGIELYNQAMKVMDIEKYMNDLDNEINELHSYANMIEENKRNETLDFISKIGAILLPPSFMTGLFGMNILTFEGTWWNKTLGLFLIILSGFVGYTFVASKEETKSNPFLGKFIDIGKKYKTEFLCLFIGFIFAFAIFFSDKSEHTETVIKNTPTVQIQNQSTKDSHDTK